MDNIYSTSEIAEIIGIHPNTVRLYEKLKIIRTLRCANYSLSSILRMINAVEKSDESDIKKIINTPEAEEEIVTACDRLLISLNNARENANIMLKQLEIMSLKFNNYTL